MTAPFEPAPGERVPALVEQFKGGLAAPIGDVYACPFAIHDAFKAGTVRPVHVPAKLCDSSPLAVTP